MPKDNLPLSKKYFTQESFLVLATSYLVIFNLLFIVQKSWLGEIWLSFLPYFLIPSILFLIWLVGVFVLKFYRPNESNLKATRLNIFTGFIVIVSCFSSSTLTLKVYHYFYQQPQVTVQTKTENALKIGFFNILETNTQYDLVNNKLQELNLDIISFAEFQENHYQNIPFLKNYQHSFPKSFPKKSGNTATIAIFSKFNFVDISYKKLANNNALIAKISFKDKLYELVINHLSNPVVPKYFDYRNQDLKFLNDFVETKKDGKVLILGDFNTTPWSSYYPEFEGYNNVFAGRGAYATWQYGPLLLPIDKMFSSKSLMIENYKIDTQNGSDHHLIWAEVV